MDVLDGWAVSDSGVDVRYLRAASALRLVNKVMNSAVMSTSPLVFVIPLTLVDANILMAPLKKTGKRVLVREF